MSKKKITLEEAKEILENDKVFYNGNKKFNVLHVGKYCSGITLEIPQEWTINQRRKPENPISYYKMKELTDGMNIDFDGEAEFLLGKYRLSKNGRPVFELTEPKDAKDIFICVDWGGCFKTTRGQYNEYAKAVGATFFTRRSSNGGGSGCDYWILPVDFVRDMESRDVSGMLQKLQENEEKRIVEIDKYIAKEDEEIKKSKDNRQRVLEEIEPIIEDIKGYEEGFTYKAEEDMFRYRESKCSCEKSKRYTDELIAEIQEFLQKEKRDFDAKIEFMPMYQELESTLNQLEIEMKYNKKSVSLSKSITGSYYDSSYGYSFDGYSSFVEDLTKYQQKIEEAQREARRKAEEIKKAAELKAQKEEAKEKGYPEEFQFWNRLGGATGLSHAYVIEADGTIREPDYNNLRNRNHVHHTNWKNVSDGTQGYIQLLPGEIIVTYQKECTRKPYIFNVEWADAEITDAQLDVVCEVLGEEASFAEDTEGKEIEDLEAWVTNAVKEKSIECRKQIKDNSFVEEIAGYAQKKVESEDKNKRAKELANEFEQQEKTQSCLGDE